MAAKFSTEKAMAAGKSAERAQDWVAATAQYEAVLDRFPRNKRAQAALLALKPKAVAPLLKSAKVTQANKNWTETIRLLEVATKLAPELVDIKRALGQSYLEASLPFQALAIAEENLPDHPESVHLLLIKGRALQDMNKPSEAKEIFLSALEIDPRSSLTLAYLSTLFHTLGDRENEREYAYRTIQVRAELPSLHWNVARCTKYTPDTPHLQEMRTLLQRLGPDAEENAYLHLSLFKAYDDIGDVDTAFAYLKENNRLNKSATGYEFKTDAIQYGLAKSLIKDPLPAPETTDGFRPIFVTGLPRTGTTLTERIIGRSEGVQGCGELPVAQKVIGRFVSELMARDNKRFTEQDRLHVREHLLEELGRYSDGSQILVDKMPLNFRWIGFICAALPEARIVHLNRDPMAVAWSLYRHKFRGEGNGFIYSFEDIARYMVLHRDLMDHWRKICGAYIHDLDYSQLVGAPEATTKSLAAFLDLEWSEAWTSPEKSARHVRTASAQQVRKPIYKGSDAGWKKYESHLEPLRQMLIKVGII